MPATQPAFRNHRFSFGQAELALHKNLMACVIFALERPVVVANDFAALEANIVCIQPGIAHRVLVPTGGAEIIYFDGLQLSHSDVPFREIDARWGHVPHCFEAEHRDHITEFRNELKENKLTPDPKVMDIVERLYDAPFERMSQGELSRELGLERTMALRHFKVTTGQTFRKFKIWAGIVAAAHSAHQGEKIGLAGVDAGFSDAAHTARTAMDTFGITPTQGLGGLLKIQTLK